MATIESSPLAKAVDRGEGRPVHELALRIGVVFPGDPTAATTASGIPAGVARGLKEIGVEPVPLRAEPPEPLNSAVWNLVAALRIHRVWSNRPRETVRMARKVAYSGPELALLRSWAARSAFNRALPLDGVVQVGTGFSLPATLPAATFEDMTVPQAVRLGYPHWRALSARAVAARMKRQGRAYSQAKACCTRTHWAADSIVEDYGVPPAKVHAVGVGRNHDPRPSERDWHNPRFLFIGREWERKNGPGVLRAFQRLRAENPGATLDVVGKHPPIELPGVIGHGPLRENDPAERATLEGLFERATCYVMPSHHEPAGIVYVEAGAAGVASIGTTRGGAGELIGDAGRLVDPDDDEALLAAMRELANPSTAARLGAEARRRAAFFTWRAVAERLVRALDPPGVEVDSLADFL